MGGGERRSLMLSLSEGRRKVRSSSEKPLFNRKRPGLLCSNRRFSFVRIGFCSNRKRKGAIFDERCVGRWVGGSVSD